MNIACYSKTLILIYTLHINLHPHLFIGQRENILEIWQTTNSQWLQTPLEYLQCYSLLYTTMFLSTVTSESNQTNVPWPFDHWLHIHLLEINWSILLSIFVLQSHFTFEEKALSMFSMDTLWKPCELEQTREKSEIFSKWKAWTMVIPIEYVEADVDWISKLMGFRRVIWDFLFFILGKNTVFLVLIRMSGHLVLLLPPSPFSRSLHTAFCALGKW